MMQDYGTDQVTVQRLMSVRTNRGMVKAIFFNAATDFFVIALLLFIGLGLFAFYHHNAGLLPEGISADAVFPYYVVHALPAGFAGLLLAAVFAAAMSSMDSGINSLATVVTHDFVRPLRHGNTDEARDLVLARLLTLLFGAAATGIAFFVSSLGHIIKAYTTFVSLFSAPILALFLLGMLTVRARFAGWVAGCLVSLPATLILQRVVKVHWVYYFPSSFLVAFIVGYAASLVLGNPLHEPTDVDLTVHGRP
jgi:SSS family solute:Na+ symporter